MSRGMREAKKFSKSLIVICFNILLFCSCFPSFEMLLHCLVLLPLCFNYDLPLVEISNLNDRFALFLLQIMF